MTVQTARFAEAPARSSSHARPTAWDELWGSPDDGPAQIAWHQLKKLSGALAEQLPLAQTGGTFGDLVGSNGLRARPVHRWFSYKEGFSPDLLDAVIAAMKPQGGGLRVADTFGGVATTALAGALHPDVAEVRSVEYSPFAAFAGRTKLLWPSLDSEHLTSLLPAALSYDHTRDVHVPGLAAFANPKIFAPQRIRTLVAARDHLRELHDADGAERDFFLLGAAAVVEDLSGAMKDGRALRIKGSRSRRPSSLANSEPLVRAQGVIKQALAGQWSAMIDDIDTMADQRARALDTDTHHLRGDARYLDRIALEDGGPAFPDSWADLSLFSPPYLNCIDYTELYKLELWFLGHITDQQSFRETRLGTLRSHPSIRFADRGYLTGLAAPVIELIDGLATWITSYGARPEVGPVVRQYFEDMYKTWCEQARVVSSQGAAVCVVANSTFSRRERQADGTKREMWRLPVLTDVILGHLALIAGFDSVEIWQARELRPRNVRRGRARESLVVARKSS